LEASVSGVLLADDDFGGEGCSFGHTHTATAIFDIYYWGRMASILVNFLVFVFISVRLRRMAIRGRSAYSTNSPPRDSDNQSIAIHTLVSRMKYYPLAQALCRRFRPLFS
jgi:hypothetical protein